MPSHVCLLLLSIRVLRKGQRKVASMTTRSATANAVLCFEPEAEFHLALQLLLRKLKDSQPSFLDDDVVHPQASPTAASLHTTPPRHDGHTPSLLHCETSVASPTTSRPTTNKESDVADVVTIMEMVDDFDADPLRRTRRSVNECFRMIRKAYLFLSSCGRTLPSAAPSTSALSGCKSSSHHANENCDTHSRSTGLSPSFAMLLSSSPGSSPLPTALPGLRPAVALPPLAASARCLRLLDGVVQSLLVYANESEPLRSVLQGDSSIVLMLCHICLEARLLEHNVQERISSGSDTVRLRSVDEVRELADWLAAQQIGSMISQLLVEVYTLELLLDAALPPSVCTSRYDGVLAVLWERKAQLTSEMLSSRSFTSNFIKKAQVWQMQRLAVMALYAPLRTRSKLFEKFATDGFLISLRNVIHNGVETLCGLSKLSALCFEDIRETVSLLSDALDLWLCITAVEGSQQPTSSTTTLGTTDPGRARSSSRVSGLGAAKSAVWTQHVEILQCVANDLCKLINVTWSGSPGGRSASDVSRAERQQQSWPPLRNLTNVSPALIEKANELLVQMLSGNETLLEVVVCALDALFDQVSCHAVPLLLPVVLRIAANPSVADGSGTLRSGEPIANIVSEWFSTGLMYDYVPWLFVQRKPWSLGRILSSLHWNGALPACQNWALTRHISRREMLAVLPFLTFAKRLLLETSWRSGATLFFKKTWLVCKSIVQQRDQRSWQHSRLRGGCVAYGLASECLSALQPLIGNWDGTASQDSLLRTVLKRARSVGDITLSPPPSQAEASDILPEDQTPTTPVIQLVPVADDSPASRVLQREYSESSEAVSPSPAATLQRPRR